MSDLLQQCSELFGEAPREFSWWSRWNYLHLTRPSWLRSFPKDKLKRLFDEAPTIFREGIVVWGHLVQANRLLFEPGRDNCPAELVFSLDNPSRVSPKELAFVAMSLFQLKGTVPEFDELRPIADHLTDERTRVFGLSVPRLVSPNLRCFLSTTFIVRKHLPGGRLRTPIFPVVALPRKPFMALPLPERFWPDALKEGLP